MIVILNMNGFTHQKIH